MLGQLLDTCRNFLPVREEKYHHYNALHDCLNEHPFKNSHDTRVICNLMTGSPGGPDAMWTVME
jgi:hypothetical protein